MGKKARKRARMNSSNSNMSSAPPTPTDNLTYAIHSANETIYGQQTLEAKQVTSVTFADISKAFDTVWVFACRCAAGVSIGSFNVLDLQKRYY